MAIKIGFCRFGEENEDFYFSLRLIASRSLGLPSRLSFESMSNFDVKLSFLGLYCLLLALWLALKLESQVRPLFSLSNRLSSGASLTFLTMLDLLSWYSTFIASLAQRRFSNERFSLNILDYDCMASSVHSVLSYFSRLCISFSITWRLSRSFVLEVKCGFSGSSGMNGGRIS